MVRVGGGGGAGQLQLSDPGRPAQDTRFACVSYSFACPLTCTAGADGYPPYMSYPMALVGTAEKGYVTILVGGVGWGEGGVKPGSGWEAGVRAAGAGVWKVGLWGGCASKHNHPRYDTPTPLCLATQFTDPTP